MRSFQLEDNHRESGCGGWCLGLHCVPSALGVVKESHLFLEKDCSAMVRWQATGKPKGPRLAAASLEQAQHTQLGELAWVWSWYPRRRSLDKVHTTSSGTGGDDPGVERVWRHRRPQGGEGPIWAQAWFEKYSAVWLSPCWP